MHTNTHTYTQPSSRHIIYATDLFIYETHFLFIHNVFLSPSRVLSFNPQMIGFDKTEIVAQRKQLWSANVKQKHLFSVQLQIHLSVCLYLC